MVMRVVTIVEVGMVVWTEAVVMVMVVGMVVVMVRVVVGIVMMEWMVMLMVVGMVGVGGMVIVWFFLKASVSFSWVSRSCMCFQVCLLSVLPRCDLHLQSPCLELASVFSSFTWFSPVVLASLVSLLMF